MSVQNRTFKLIGPLKRKLTRGQKYLETFCFCTVFENIRENFGVKVHRENIVSRNLVVIKEFAYPA